MLYLKTMGRLSLHVGGAEGFVRLEDSSALVVLAYLALAPGHGARRDHISELLWPHADPSRARQSLRQSLYYLTRRAGSTPVRAENGSLRLDASDLRCDVWELDLAMSEEDFERVVQVYGGGFLQSVERRLGRELQQWLESQNDRVRLCLRLAYTRLIEEATTTGDSDAAVRLSRRYAQLDPLDDTAQVTLIHALRAAGDDAGALQAFEGYRTLLREAAGDRPSPELEEVLAELQGQMLAEPEWRPLAPTAVPDSLSPDHSRANDESPRASTLAGRAHPWRRRSGWRTAAIALGLIALVGTGMLSMSLRARMLHAPQASAATTSPDLRGTLWAKAAGSRSDVAIHLEDAGLRTERARHTTNGYWTLSPDGSRAADIALGPHGYDLTLASPPGTRPRVVLDAPADEKPLAWSPDSRRLLYVAGEAVPQNHGYAQRMEIYDVARKASRTLTALTADAGVYAAWSPDGTRIAYVDAETDGSETTRSLWWIEAGGAGRRWIASGVGAAPPTWSPDGAHLAYAAEGSGSLDLFEIAVGEDGPHVLVDSPAEDHDPVWLSEAWIAFLRGSPAGSRLWAVNRRTGELRPLETGFALQGLRPAATAERPPWIERLEAHLPVRRVTPGLTVPLRARAFDADGAPREGDVSGLTWRVSDPSIARVSGDGTLRVTDLGRTELVADLRGWRSDTLELLSVALEVEPLEPIMVEDWTRGIRDNVWELVGDPKPYARASGGPEGGGVFVANGDAAYASVAVTRRVFDTGHGLTIEVWGRMPFTGRHFENYVIALLRRPRKGHLSAPSLDYLLRYDVHGKTSTASLSGSGSVLALPFPERADAWHLYALQVEGDGTASLIMDGRLVWREPGLLGPKAIRAGAVALGDRSLGVEIQHGELRIYEGAKYRLPHAKSR